MKIIFEATTKEEKKAAKHMLVWLCEQGEQQYWDWMDIREEEEKGLITFKNFDYDQKKLMVEASNLGRFDKEEIEEENL